MGGFAAIAYFFESGKLKQFICQLDFRAAPGIPADSRAVFAYANSNSKLLNLTREIAERRGLEFKAIDSESAWLHEQIKLLEIKTIRELDGYVKQYGPVATKLTDYMSPQGSIDTGFLLGRILEIVVIKRGGIDALRNFSKSLQFSSRGSQWEEEIFAAYEQINELN